MAKAEANSDETATGDEPGDDVLLERFAARREAAFAALVQRHGPLVFGVCRRVLQHEQDAEDAFQAVFCVLARKASAIRRGTAVGGWLYAVASRIARKAKASQVRRRMRESELPDVPAPDMPAELWWARPGADPGRGGESAPDALPAAVRPVSIGRQDEPRSGSRATLPTRNRIIASEPCAAAASCRSVGAARDGGLDRCRPRPLHPGPKTRPDAPMSQGAVTKPDTEAMQGTWNATKVRHGGQEMIPPENVQMVFAGDRVTSHFPGMPALSGTFRLDPSKDPKEIDVIFPAGVTWPGIYRLEGDQWELCIDLQGRERPVSLTDSRFFFSQMKRSTDGPQ
jgi:uncharacterized protein (TIGR03067 family)